LDDTICLRRVDFARIDQRDTGRKMVIAQANARRARREVFCEFAHRAIGAFQRDSVDAAAGFVCLPRNPQAPPRRVVHQELADERIASPASANASSRAMYLERDERPIICSLPTFIARAIPRCCSSHASIESRRPAMKPQSRAPNPAAGARHEICACSGVMRQILFRPHRRSPARAGGDEAHAHVERKDVLPCALLRLYEEQRNDIEACSASSRSDDADVRRPPPQTNHLRHGRAKVHVVSACSNTLATNRRCQAAARRVPDPNR
jgi:hypothetical protein